MKSASFLLLALLAVAAIAEENVPTGESYKAPYNPLDKSEMDDLASADDVAKFVGGLATDAALFVEDREHSIRWAKLLPKRWLSNLPAHTGTFQGTAQPGEFYVFQIGAFAAKRELTALSIAFGDLAGAAGTIKGSDLRCFNLGGINNQGQPFAKNVSVAKGKLCALWIGIAVPKEAKRNYQGTITVKDAAGLLLPVRVELKVEGAVLSDFGDRDAWRLSRLRWLDSAIGFDDNTVTKPYIPLQRQASTVSLLGRDLTLDKSGLPEQIQSFFSAGNTAIATTPTRSLLTTPFHFIIETVDGGAVALKPGSLEILREQKGAIEWRTTSRGDGIELTVSGLMEYDGFVKYVCRVKAEREMQVRDIRLEFAVTKDADYFMGLGQHGGKRPEKLDWKWDPKFHQDGFWIGAVNGGFKIQFFGSNYRTPLINCYYHFRELMTPESWGGADGKSGGIRLATGTKGDVQVVAFSGPRTLKADEPLDYGFQLFLTPFHTLNTQEQWSLRYHHANNENYRDAAGVKAMGANTINIHQSREANPTINYPYFDLSMPLLKQTVVDAHASGVKVKIYYTTREITNNLKELFAFWSLDGEIICPSPGLDGIKAHPLTNGKGPHPWLVEHLGETGFIPAWRDVLRGRYKGMLDLAVITTPESRLDNFYMEGLAFTLRETDIDGLYIDDTALGRKAFQRAHRIFEAAGKPMLADMHSWNHWNPTAGGTPSAYVFMQNFPYYHRLWLGEGFNCNAPVDNLLVEQSGIPFGLMSEMLQGVNSWHGMVFGEVSRLGWSHDPRPIWKFWDEFGMAGTEMVGFWDPACPVRSGNEKLPVTVYRKSGKTLVAIASWSDKNESVKLTVDWKALGLDATKVSFYAPAIADFQKEAVFAADGALPVAKGRGWLLVLDETPRTPTTMPSTGDPLKGLTVKAVEETAFEIKVPANTVQTKDIAWSKGATVAVTHIDPLKDEGQSWGVGLAVGWSNGKYVQINARTDNRWELRKNGTAHFAGQHARGTPATLAVKLTDESVLLYAKEDASAEWERLDEFPRTDFPGVPSTIRIGKIGTAWKPTNHSSPGATSPCRIEWVKQY